MTAVQIELALNQPVTLGQVREWLKIADDARFTDADTVEVKYGSLTVSRPPAAEAVTP